MIRTQIQLPEEEYDELRKAAALQHRSMADCVREGIRLFLNRQRSAQADLGEVSGKFRPIPISDLKPHDRWIVQAIADSKSKKAK